MNNGLRSALTWFALIGVIVFVHHASPHPRGDALSYASFKTNLAQGRLLSATVTPAEIRGRYRNPLGQTASFRTVPENDPTLLAELRQHQIGSFAGSDAAFRLLINFGPALFFLRIWWLMISRMRKKAGTDQAAPEQPQKTVIF